ncbi:MAG: YciI family protein [Actinomycetota bacterium]
MEYMIINRRIETNDGPAPGTPEFGEFMGRWMAYNQRLIDGGHWVAGASLAPSETATLVHKSGGDASVLDGPYAETKEQIGGFYLIEAADLDEALELASAMPVDDGTLEVRPVAFRPDTGQ